MRITRVIGFLVVSLASWPQSRPKDVLEMFHRMQSALAGPRIGEVRDLDWTGIIFVWDRGAQIGKVTRRVRGILPQQFRQEKDMPNGRPTFYFDGTSGWGSFCNGPVVPLVGKELTLIQDEFAALYFNFESADALSDYEIVQCAPYTIRLTRKTDKSRHTEIELDPETWLPRKSGDLCPMDNKQLSGNYSEVLQWRDVDGVKVEQRTMKYSGNQLMLEVITTNAKINGGQKVADLAHAPE